MQSIHDYVTAKELGIYWEISQKERPPFLGEALFPNKKQRGTDLSYIKGARMAPVALSLSAYDAQAIPITRQGFEKLQTEMPFFRQRADINEKQRKELNNVIASGNQSAIDLILREIFNDKINLIERASVTRERLRMQMLTTGIISLSGNGQSYTFDYRVPSTHKITPTNKWSNSETADPVQDILDALDLIAEDTGVRPTRGVMNAKTLKLIQNSKAVKNTIYVLANGMVTPNRSETLNFIQNETGVTFYIYDKQYALDEGTTQKYIADGTVTLFPEGALGNTHFGETPEESDLMGSNAVEDVYIVDGGVAIMTEKIAHPVTVSTFASMVCLPSFEMADQVAMLSVI